MVDGDEHLGRTAPSMSNAQDAVSNAQDAAALGLAVQNVGSALLQNYQNGLDQQNTSNQVAPFQPTPRTIVSGVERLMQLAKGSRFLVNDLDDVVGSLTGNRQGPVEARLDEGSANGTAETIHAALDAIEEAMGRLVAMTQRAKAAHG